MTVEPLPPRARRFEYLDLVRLLCALGVVMFHYATVAPYTGVLSQSFYFAPNLFVYGQYGVHIFFIVSGFVITLSARGRGPFEFAWARFLRLYPAYWICCTLTMIVSFSFGQIHNTLWAPNFPEFLINLTMLQSFLGVNNVDGVYWSLVVELRFYAVVFLLMLLRLRIDSLPVILVWIALCVADPYLLPVIGKIGMVKFAPFFIIGILIQSLIDPRHRTLKIILLLVSSALSGETILAMHQIQEGRHFFAHNPFIAIGVVFGGALLVLACTFAPEPKRYTSIMMALGALTYPLYLLHSTIGLVAIRELSGAAPAPLITTAVIAGILAAVAIIALFLEPRLRNGMRGGEKIFTAFMARVFPRTAQMGSKIG